MSHRSVDGENRVRHARGGNLGRITANTHRDDLPVLRRGMRANRALAGRPNCESQFAARSLRHAGQPVHQRPLRLAIHTISQMTPLLSGTVNLFWRIATEIYSLGEFQSLLHHSAR